MPRKSTRIILLLLLTTLILAIVLILIVFILIVLFSPKVPPTSHGILQTIVRQSYLFTQFQRKFRFGEADGSPVERCEPYAVILR